MEDLKKSADMLPIGKEKSPQAHVYVEVNLIMDRRPHYGPPSPIEPISNHVGPPSPIVPQ